MTPVRFFFQPEGGDRDSKDGLGEEGKGGDDALDALRYTLMGFREVENKIPKSYWVADRTSEVLQQHDTAFSEPLTDPTRLAMIAARQQVLYEKEYGGVGRGGSFTFPRGGSQRHRVQ